MMAIHAKYIKFFISKGNNEIEEITHHVASFEPPQAQTAEPIRMSMPSYEVSFMVGADSEFAKALRRYLRRKWTIAWLEQFAAWAFGKN